MKNVTIIRPKSDIFISDQPCLIKKYKKDNYGLFAFGEYGNIDTLIKFDTYKKIEGSYLTNHFKVTNFDNSVQYYDSESRTFTDKYTEGSDFNEFGFAIVLLNNRRYILDSDFNLAYEIDNGIVYSNEFLNSYSRFAILNINKFPVQTGDGVWVMWDVEKNAAAPEFGTLINLNNVGYHCFYSDIHNNDYFYDLITESNVQINSDLSKKYQKIEYDISVKRGKRKNNGSWLK
jgi:hypothetical protein